jgi:hypothetical protein
LDHPVQWNNSRHDCYIVRGQRFQPNFPWTTLTLVAGPTRENILGVNEAAVHGPIGDSIEHEESNPTHLATGPPTHDKKRTGEIWMTNVIPTWLQQRLNLWKIRNLDRHGTENDTRRQARDSVGLR